MLMDLNEFMTRFSPNCDKKINDDTTDSTGDADVDSLK